MNDEPLEHGTDGQIRVWRDGHEVWEDPPVIPAPCDGLAPEQVRALMGTLNRNRVAHRSQGGRDLSYLEAWDVKATLIRLFGFTGFSAECVDARILREFWYPSPRDESKQLVMVTALCTVRLTIHKTGAVYQETGAASQSGPDHGEVCDFAIKTAESDALKRAATYLGTQFGLGLYDQGSTREVVRVLVEPTQRDMLPKPDTGQEGTGADLSPEAAAALEHSLGATVVSEGTDDDFQAPSDAEALPVPPVSDAAIASANLTTDAPPAFTNKADTPSAAAAAVAAIAETRRKR